MHMTGIGERCCRLLGTLTACVAVLAVAGLKQEAMAVSAEGGTVTYYQQNGTNYTVHTYANNGTLTVTSGGLVEYLVIGGGGGGGGGASGGNRTGGGGGGAGGYRCSVSGERSGGGVSAEAALSLGVGSYTIGVGTGGAGGPVQVGNNASVPGANGGDSFIQDLTLAALVRSAGGGGGAGGCWTDGGQTAAGRPGGAGGGSIRNSSGGSGSASQGYAGGGSGVGRASGGGGGAGNVGLAGATAGTDAYGKLYSKAHGGSGGTGVFSRITGSLVQRAGGGGGGCDEVSNYRDGYGGDGGGGNGGPTAGSNGNAGTGSGGGGGNSAYVGGRGGSGIVIIRYVTAASNQAPVANAQFVNLAEDTASSITLTGTDADGDGLTYTVLSQPAHGALSGTAPNVSYTPAVNYNGTDSFTFKVSDGSLDSAEATVSITVAAVNDEPTVTMTALPPVGAAPLAVCFVATGADVDGDTLTYAWDFGDSTTGDGMSVSHTYAYPGSYSAAVTVSDGNGGSNSAQVAIAASSASQLPAPAITPAGGTFDQPLTVTITPAVSTVMSNTPGWRTGVKYPGLKIESVEALTADGDTIAAMRGRTMAKSSYLFPGVNMSPDCGSFPFYIWNLADTSDIQRHSTYYRPSLYVGVTDNTGWDGNGYDFYFGETGNRVFLLLEQQYAKAITLWSCAAGAYQYTTDEQRLAQFPLPSVTPLAGSALKMEFVADKVRILMGGAPLVSANTDAGGWVSYIGPSASGRVNATLGATRFWFSLAGGELPGPREVVVSDKPQVTTRFTYDGTPVTETSLAVTSKLTLTHDTTLKARCYGPVSAPSVETVAEFDSLMPELPAESYVSPVYVELFHATLDGSSAVVSLSGPSGATNGLALENHWFVLRYPLSATGPTPVVLHRSGIPDLSANIDWRALDLGEYECAEEMTIRLGESLLLTSGIGQTGALHIVVLDSSNNVFRAYDGVAGETFPVLFDQPGTFEVVAEGDNLLRSSMFVHVAYVNFDGPIACQVGFKREKGVEVYGPTNQLFFVAKNPALLEVTVKAYTNYGARLYLKPLARGTPVVQARLGSATGPVLSEQEIDEFTVDSSAATHVVVNGKTDTANTILTLKPWIPDLEVNCAMFASFSTFAGGGTVCRIDTSDKTSVNVNGRPAVELVVDPATGETQAIIRVDFEIPPDESSYCFSATFDQHSKYGTPVSHEIKCNGKACTFGIEPIYICDCDTSAHTLTLVPDAANAGNHVPSHNHSTSVYWGSYSLSGVLTFNCSSSSGNWLPTVQLTTGASGGDKYGVIVCGTVFAEVVKVVKVEIDDIVGVGKDCDKDVKVTLTPSPSGVNVKLALSTESGTTGEAKFKADTGADSTETTISETKTLTIKGNTESSKAGNITVSAALDASTYSCASKAFTVVKMDLVGDLNHDDSVGGTDGNDDVENSAPGLVVAMGGNRARIKLEGLPADLAVGEVALMGITPESGTGEIKVWDAATGGSLILDSSQSTSWKKTWTLGNSSKMSTLPAVLWVEGTKASAAKGDVQLSLGYKPSTAGDVYKPVDKLVVTVLKVEIADIDYVLKGGSKEVKVTLTPSPLGQDVGLSLETTEDTSGSATFEDDENGHTVTARAIQETSTLKIKGVTESGEEGNITLSASLGGNSDACASKSFTVIKVELHPKDADFESGKAGRVMISAKQDSDYYTDVTTTEDNKVAQTADREVMVTAHLTPADITRTVYFRVVDPDADDASSYETDAVKGDNHASTYKAGKLSANEDSSAEKTINSVQVAAAEVKLTITDQYSGDNYQVECSLDSGYSTLADKTTVLTAWKRIYVEKDQMYKSGSDLASDFCADSDTAADSVTVVDGSVFSINDSVTVFDADHETGESATITAVAGNVLTLSVDLANSYKAGYGLFGKGAAVAKSGAGTFDVDVLGRVGNAFGSNTDGSDGGCFVEVVALADGAGKVPFRATMDSAVNDYTEMWFKNIDAGGENYIHIIAANSNTVGDADYGLADASDSLNQIFIFCGTIESKFSTDPSAAKSDTVCHEIGHHFGLKGSVDCDGNHPSQWCHEGSSTDKCVMDKLRDREDKYSEFCHDSPDHIDSIRDASDGL